MIRVERLGYALLLIGVATVMGHSQETKSEYVAPSEAVQRGRAPRMQVQLLNPGEPTKQYAVIFYQGDEAFSDFWSLRRSTTLRVHISPLLEH